MFILKSKHNKEVESLNSLISERDRLLDENQKLKSEIKRLKNQLIATKEGLFVFEVTKEQVVLDTSYTKQVVAESFKYSKDNKGNVEFFANGNKIAEFVKPTHVRRIYVD